MKQWRDRATGGLAMPAGLAGTMLLHASVVLTVLVAARHPAIRPLPPAYRVELVAAPRSGGGDATPAAPTQPQPSPPTPTPAPRTAARTPAPTRTPPRAAPAAHPAPPARTPAAAPATPAAPSRTNPAAAPAAATAAAAAASANPPGPVTPNTNAAPGTGTAPATVRTEGVEFPFPGYLRNLVARVYRRWSPPAGNADLEAEMIFLVHRDGSMTGLQFVRRSGSFAFDLEAQGAVEAAARAGEFGPLPPGYGPDVLPVSFFFSPRSLR
jgi:protein TonB